MFIFYTPPKVSHFPSSREIFITYGKARLPSADYRQDKASNTIGLPDLITLIKKNKKSPHPAEISSLI
jgi:hypothetical protein